MFPLNSALTFLKIDDATGSDFQTWMTANPNKRIASWCHCYNPSIGKNQIFILYFT